MNERYSVCTEQRVETIWSGRRVAKLLLVAVTCTLAFAAAMPGRAQQEAAASIVGKVTDASGAPIPGAKVKATSPALQVPQVDTVSDDNGDYRLLNLPAPGTYMVTFEQQGFQQLVRKGVVLSIGFAGRVDAALKLGEVTQTVEVSGATPVVDTVNTSGGATLQEQELKTAPRGTGIEDLLPMAAGVSTQGPPDVGDSQLAYKYPIVTYGVVMEPTLDLEGINLTTSHDESTAVYFDAFSLGEVEFRTVGNNADVAFPGVDMVAQIKSGGNDFHGDAMFGYENPSFQGNNVSSTLAAQGIKNTLPLQGAGFYVWSADLGGRIIRNKLWFYGESSRESENVGAFGVVAFPGTVPTCTIETRWILAKCPSAIQAATQTRLQQYSTKESYQLKPTIKLIGVYQYSSKYLSQNNASTSVPLPSAQLQKLPSTVWKGEVQWVPNARWMLEAMAGFGGYRAKYIAVPGSVLGAYGWGNNAKGADFPGDPTQIDVSNGNLATGTRSGPLDRPTNRYEARGVLSYVPERRMFGGSHIFKLGSVETWEEGASRVPIDDAAGDYTLTFAGGNATTASSPSQITLYNYPVTPVNYEYTQSLFVTDAWTVKRITIDYGVRWERYNSFLPEQTKPKGQMSGYSDANGLIFPGDKFAPQDILTWTDVVPRVGAAWDIRGNGKTVLKANFGMFGDTMGVLWANSFNGNGVSSKTYPWLTSQSNGGCYTGSPAGSELFTYDEYQCDVNPAWFTTALPTLTPTSATGAGAQINNTGLKQPKTFEYMVKMERQIGNNMALKVTYLRHSLYDLYDAATNPSGGFPSSTTTFVGNGINVGRPYTGYTPVTRPNPLGGTITLYNFTGTCSNSCTANEVINTASNRPDIFNTFEIALEKRYSKRLTALLSFWGTKNHRWLQGTAGISGSPNDDYFPLDKTFNWEARADVSYHLPWGIEADALYRAESGFQWAPTGNFTGLNQGTVTVRLSQFGTNQGPVIPVLNLRGAKSFRVGEGKHLIAEVQLFNALNSSAATGFTSVVGPTYGNATGILAPRVMRIGGRFEF